MPAEPRDVVMPVASTASPFLMLGDDGALCVDGVCAVPAANAGTSAPSTSAPAASRAPSA